MDFFKEWTIFKSKFTKGCDILESQKSKFTKICDIFEYVTASCDV